MQDTTAPRLVPNPLLRISSECVSDGHPDKICDQIADAVLDACLAQDPGSRVAVEAAFKGHDLFVFGEVTTGAKLDIPAIARGVLTDIGHGEGRWGLHLDKLEVRVLLAEQAPEIREAVGAFAGRDSTLGFDNSRPVPHSLYVSDMARSLATNIGRPALGC